MPVKSPGLAGKKKPDASKKVTMTTTPANKQGNLKK